MVQAPFAPSSSVACLVPCADPSVAAVAVHTWVAVHTSVGRTSAASVVRTSVVAWVLDPTAAVEGLVPTGFVARTAAALEVQTRFQDSAAFAELALVRRGSRRPWAASAVVTSAVVD